MPKEIWCSLTNQPNTTLDITAWWEIKIKAILQHKTQVQDVEKLLEESGTFEGKVDGFNKGGLIVPMYGLRGFVPASQLSITRRMAVTGDTPDARYAKMIGEHLVEVFEHFCK